MNALLSIVADENIPFAEEAFAAFGQVRCFPGRTLSAADLRAAEVLLVRSVTRVDRALLGGTPVRFVGSATIGTDHIDRIYLESQHIAFAHAPGSNADSVVEYVLAALLRLAVRAERSLRGLTVGIVGCGRIGGRLARRLPVLGVRVLANDPPRAAAAEAEGRPHPFLPLDALLAEADVLTLHTPLTHSGPHPTYHLLDASALRRMKSGAWLLNTGRGAAVSNDALRRVCRDGALGAVVLDVWEHEPTPDPDLLACVDLATPHIAGYSFDGKVRGTQMLHEALAAHLGGAPGWDAAEVLAAAPEDRLALAPPDPSLPETAYLDALVRQMYPLAADDARLRRLLALPPDAQGAYFSGLRKAYPRRRAFARHTIAAAAVPAAYRRAIAEGLGVQLG